jgi:signal transduction histidine kinase
MRHWHQRAHFWRLGTTPAVRASLRRRLFLWFGLSTALSLGLALGVTWLFTRGHAHPPMGLVVAVMALGLWAVSGRIAWRLVRPFTELSRVAQELGAGRLHSRTHLGPHHGFEAHALGHALNDMAERIERQLRDQRELLAAVSHELRTPLARMRVLVELARGDGVGEDTLRQLDREVVEMDGLVGELLANSRLDFAALTYSKVPAEDLALRALERAGLARSLLRNEVGDRTVEVDATLMARALANLLENAMRHGGGVKALRLAALEGKLEVSVEDAGPGFPPGEEERVFQAFHRGPNPGAEERPGLGLGLSLVRRIAEAHGGRAFAMNLTGGGARVGFTVTA